MVVLHRFNGPHHTAVLLHGVGTKEQGTFYKYLEMSKDVVTTKDFNKAKEEWLEEKKQNQ